VENTFKKLNLIGGGVSTAIAFVVYYLTMEPTVSFWDCGEFIATAFKLQVGHPPGAPLFAMTGRLFALLASSAEEVAAMINLLSVTASALTIGFLFWTITGLAKKIFKFADKAKSVQWNTERLWKSIGAGFIGAMAYTFSDTFWFSAVEAEVYASSSLFTAIVFWAVLKWDAEVDDNKTNADRWLLLIAYFMGLSIGVHLLNLLTIPAIGLVYFYKHHKAGKYGIWMALIISFIVLGFVQYGIIPGTISIAAAFERIMVNSLGLSFGTGFFTFCILLVAGIAFGLYYTAQKQKNLLNLSLWGVLLVIVGYSSYGMIAVRSIANTPMDENNPEDVYSMIAYLNREQYGDRPLLYGQYFDADILKVEKGKDIYMKAFLVKDNSGKVLGSFNIEHDAMQFIANNPNPNTLSIKHAYIVIDKKPEYKFDSRRKTLFPRIWSYQQTHKSEYQEWTGLKENQKPGQIHNIRFFINYQVYWMYFRYFMWNFAGRENDLQGHGEKLLGHWISGIGPIDNLVTQSYQSNLPDRFAKNKGRNVYYFLPLILGILGLLYHYRNHKEGFNTVLVLFLMTGVAIVVYLNQTPLQPRERDYAYAGSFYAFCIWIGLGFMYVFDSLLKILKKERIAGATAITLCTLAVPVLMGTQNWDDHDRSNRYTARDFAYNYLNSCENDAILFTNGDNDTFPLWYVQEVESGRTDVRIVNLSLLQTDWYITQMKRGAYDGKPVPFSLTEPEYRTGQRDQVLMDGSNKMYFTVSEHMEWLRKTDGSNLTPTQSGDRLFFLRSNKFILPVNKDAILRSGWMNELEIAALPNELRWEINKSYVLKNEIMILDLLANFNWERPIYFSVTVGPNNFFGMEKFFSMEGLAYRLMPFETASHDQQTGEVNAEKMYDNLMEKFKWGNMNQNVYLDETNFRMMYNFRSMFWRLAEKLRLQGDVTRAEKVLDKVVELLPDHVVQYDYFSLLVASSYIQMNLNDKATEILKILIDRYDAEFAYYERYAPAKGKSGGSRSASGYRIDANMDQERYRAEIISAESKKMLQRISMQGTISPAFETEPQNETIQ
jgi:hypothetical protein